MTPQEIIKEIQKLPPSDWQTIKNTIERSDINGQEIRTITEDELEQRLYAKGIIGTIPNPIGLSEDDDWEPIEITGEPLSETIIRERG
jgi:hypothetical protein